MTEMQDMFNSVPALVTETGTPAATNGYDYSALPQEIASAAIAAACRVTQEYDSATKAVTSAAIMIGGELLAIKAKLEHGEFGKWIAAEFPFSHSAANKYMQAAQVFGAEDKFVTVTNLQPTTVYALAAPTTPTPVREQVIERLKAGDDLDDDRIRDMVREAREAEKEERRLARLTPEMLKKEKDKEARQRRSRERREREEREREQSWEDERRGSEERGRRAAELVASRLTIDEIRDLLMDLGKNRETYKGDRWDGDFGAINAFGREIIRLGREKSQPDIQRVPAHLIYEPVEMSRPVDLEQAQKLAADIAAGAVPDPIVVCRTKRFLNGVYDDAYEITEGFERFHAQFEILRVEEVVADVRPSLVTD